jgi:tetratricopeptide (TPR) repeat protein
MMTIFARYLGVVVAVGCAAMASSSLNAQEPSDLNRLYSQGVNAYFAGRSSEAESNLSQALALEGNNPLLYYFRALSLMRMGRVDEARGDMMVGANLEAQAPQRFAVGRALERVQGSYRLMLEQYRRQARVAAAAAPRQATQLEPRQTPQLRRQPQQASFNDDAVLRQRIAVGFRQPAATVGRGALSARATINPLAAATASADGRGGTIVRG